MIEPVWRPCSLCKSPHKAQVHALIATGMPYKDIHAETQKMGRAFKAATISKHVRTCLHGVRPTLDEATAQGVADGQKGAQTDAEVDFAILVQRRATELMRSGDLRVTATHGLQAQALLDRRLEKQADRDLALNMARLLSGAIIMTPMTVIEGRAEPRQLPDGLAPEGVYESVDA